MNSISKQCILCGVPTIFYIWTTSRYFNVKKLNEVRNPPFTKGELNILRRDGDVVCCGCVDKYGLMKR